MKVLIKTGKIDGLYYRSAMVDGLLNRIMEAGANWHMTREVGCVKIECTLDLDQFNSVAPYLLLLIKEQIVDDVETSEID